MYKNQLFLCKNNSWLENEVKVPSSGTAVIQCPERPSHVASFQVRVQGPHRRHWVYTHPLSRASWSCRWISAWRSCWGCPSLSLSLSYSLLYGTKITKRTIRVASKSEIYLAVNLTQYMQDVNTKNCRNTSETNLESPK